MVVENKFRIGFECWWSVLSEAESWERSETPMGGITCDHACFISQRAAVTTRYRHAMPLSWSLPFLDSSDQQNARKYALIILNQPFSLLLLQKLWHSTHWHCCADGGANRLHDVLSELRSVSHATSGQDPRPACVTLQNQGCKDSNFT